ncbi:MAG: hypothetical protein WC933_03600 [Candidatus Paceibacterota bacterium]|jgi:hypothetical protein
METKKLSKLDKDWKNGLQDRLSVISQLIKNGIYFEPVHPCLKLLTAAEKKDLNSVLNRILDRGRDDGMGLDADMSFNGHSEKIRVLFRWFSDPDIFIKETQNRDLLSSYDRAILIFLNNPRKDKNKEVKYYNILTFDWIKKQGWVWVLPNRKKNANRLILMDKKGKSIPAKTLTQYPINGGKSIFGKSKSIWDSLKGVF